MKFMIIGFLPGGTFTLQHKERENKQVWCSDTVEEPNLRIKEDKVSRIDGKDYCEKRNHTEKEIQKPSEGSP